MKNVVAFSTLSFLLLMAKKDAVSTANAPASGYGVNANFLKAIDR